MREFLRDLALVFIVAVLTAMLTVGKGITHLGMEDLRGLLDAGVASAAAMAVMYLTPITRKYGTGKVDETPAKHEAK